MLRSCPSNVKQQVVCEVQTGVLVAMGVASGEVLHVWAYVRPGAVMERAVA